MNAILIQPKTEKELDFVKQVLRKNNIISTVISDEDVEDAYFLKQMMETDANDIVSKEQVMKKLEL